MKLKAMCSMCQIAHKIKQTHFVSQIFRSFHFHKYIYIYIYFVTLLFFQVTMATILEFLKLWYIWQKNI